MTTIPCNITCPKCDRVFTDYAEFYAHYVTEPTPRDRRDRVTEYEDAWRRVGAYLAWAVGGESEGA